MAVACTACSDDGPSSDAERFCGEARANPDLITNPSITTEDELDAVLDYYRLMGELAPLAIAEEWAVLVNAYETAATLVPGDTESEQQVAMTMYASEPSAYRVQTWIARNCGVALPITTIAPQAPVTAESPMPPTGSTANTAAP